MAGQPLVRFRKAVNKSIEQRRQMLARFREAVEQSVAQHKKEKFRRPSQRRKRSDVSSPRHSQFRRMSTRIEIASLGGSSVGSSSAYFDDLNDTISEEDLEVRIQILAEICIRIAKWLVHKMCLESSYSIQCASLLVNKIIILYSMTTSLHLWTHSRHFSWCCMLNSIYQCATVMLKS